MYSGPGGQCDDNLRFPWIVVSVMWVNREKFATFMSERCAACESRARDGAPHRTIRGRVAEWRRMGNGRTCAICVCLLDNVLKHVYWVVYLKYVSGIIDNCAEYV